MLASPHSIDSMFCLSSKRLGSLILDFLFKKIFGISRNVFCFRFEQYSVLIWKGQDLSPAQEVKFVRLFPHDRTAPPEKAYGPLGVKGVDEQHYRRWRVKEQLEVLCQGEGYVEDHYGCTGNLSSGKGTREWHSDGLYVIVYIKNGDDAYVLCTQFD